MHSIKDNKIHINRLKAFTLIELLVTVTIIAILASVVTVNYLQAQKRSRDGRRAADMATVATAMDLYYEDNGTYVVTGCGYTGGGNGWFSYLYPAGSYLKSISGCLLEGKYLSAEIIDPSGSSYCGSEDCISHKAYPYMLYHSGTTKVSIYARMETDSAAMIKTATDFTSVTTANPVAENRVLRGSGVAGETCDMNYYITRSRE